MPISNLLADFLDDFRDPNLLWQVGAIAVCAVLGWGLARLIRRAFVARDDQGALLKIGVESFARVLGPLLIVALLALAKLFMAKSMHVNLLRVALPVFASLAVIRTAFYLMRRVFARGGQVGATILTFEKVFSLLVWLAVTLYIAGLWPDIIELLDTTTVPLGRHNVSVATILQASASVVVLLVLAMWAGAVLEERLMSLENVHSSLRVVTARLGRAILIVVAVLVSLSLVGIDLTVLSVFGGALGVGLGLGLQKIASNYVSGFVILLERSLSIGDMIIVDKYNGKVTQINTRYTVLQGLDGTESVLPNEMLISGPVQNNSLSNRQLRIATQLTVAYDTDINRLLPLLEQVVVKVPRVLAEPAPGAVFLKFGADGFDIEVGMWIGDPENGRGGVLSDANKAIWALLQENDVKLPYPTRDVRIIAQPEPK
ncbi:MAG: mechanosensitive ion channel domain-containing protein [Pseudomonadota bacterium]